MKNDSLNEIEMRVVEELAVLKTWPERDAEKERTGRLAFLQEAGRMLPSPAPDKAQNRWLELIWSKFSISNAKGPTRWSEVIWSKFTLSLKKNSNWLSEVIWSKFTISPGRFAPVLTPIATVLVIVALLLGGTGVTVAAARGSLPDSALYPVKLWSEDLQLALEDDPQKELQLRGEFLDERIEEITLLIERGGIPSEEFEDALQNQIVESIELALTLPPEQTAQALEQIHTRLETHTQALVRLQTRGSDKAFETVLRTRLMMLAKMKQVDEKLSTPAANENKKQPDSDGAPVITDPENPTDKENGKTGTEQAPANNNSQGQDAGKADNKPTANPNDKATGRPEQNPTNPNGKPAAVKTPVSGNEKGNSTEAPKINPPRQDPPRQSDQKPGDDNKEDSKPEKENSGGGKKK